MRFKYSYMCNIQFVEYSIEQIGFIDDKYINLFNMCFTHSVY